MNILKFLIVFYFLPFVIYTAESSDSGAVPNPSIYQLRARSQPRSEGRFSGPAIVLEPDKEAVILGRLKGIYERCMDRNRRGRRKYPRSFSPPKDEEEERQNNDTRYLNKFSDLVESSGLSEDSEAMKLFNEIWSWKPDDEESQAEKIQAYEQRLQEIKYLALERERMGMNKYPMRDGLDSQSQENKDAMFLSKKPQFREVMGLWEEIRAWKPLSAQRRERNPKGTSQISNSGEPGSSSQDPSPAQIPAPKAMRKSFSDQNAPSRSRDMYQDETSIVRTHRGIGPPDEKFRKAWFDQSLKLLPEEPKKRVSISKAIYVFFCLVFISLHIFFNHPSHSSSTMFYEEF